MLQEADDFLNTDIIIPVKTDAKYDIYTIKIGLIIFRGDFEKKTLINKNIPAFFSDIITATIFTRGNSKYLYGFKVKKQPILFHLSYKNLINLKKDKRLREKELEALNKYLQYSFINPIDFLNLEDAPKLYLNRLILNIVCRLGYDGWLVYPESLKQRLYNGVNYKYSFYSPEITLCKWSNFLDVLS